MKKKIVSKWLHRLPVLLLALILAFMPLVMAEPVHADVLNGSLPYIAEVGETDFSLPMVPDLPGFFPSVYFIRSESEFYVYYSSTSDPSMSKQVNGYYMSSSTKRIQLIVDASSGLMHWSDFQNLPYGVFPIDAVESGAVGGFLFPVTVLSSDASAILPAFFHVVYGDIGVLSVFTGVGTWLSGAVQNFSTMFWTAESGMTVLGYLAVASLALAVILLIFYLIAGWLKFH